MGEEGISSTILIGIIIIAVVVGGTAVYISTRQPEFQIMNLSLSSTKVAQGESITAEVKVANIGDAKGTYEVELKLESKTFATKEVTLEPGQSKTVSFEVKKQELGSYNLGTGDLSKSFDVAKPAEFEVENLAVPEEIFVGRPFVASVDVINVGGIEGTYEGILKINGRSMSTKEINVAPSESQEVRFDVSVDEVGNYSIGISGVSKNFYAWSFDVTKINAGRFDPETDEIISATEFKQGDVVWVRGEVDSYVQSLNLGDSIHVYNPSEDVIWEENWEGEYYYSPILVDDSFVLTLNAPTGTYEIVYKATNADTGKTKTVSSTFEVERLPEESPILRNFSWEDHLGEEWTWDNVGIEQSRYDFYRNKSHTALWYSEYTEFVTYEDSLIQSMADELSELYSGSESKANCILSFVQSLPYLPEDEEYIRYPVETVVDRGDCEDTAILFAAIMKAAGYDVALIDLEGHMLTGVVLSSEPTYGTQDYIHWWEKNGKRYYTCETTGEGWNIGDLPEEYQDKSAHVLVVD